MRPTSRIRSLRLLAALCAALTLAFAGVAHSAGSTSAPTSSSAKDKISKGEVETSRKYYDEITKFYGIYEDQAVQDYVNAVGQRVARASDMPDVEWHFTVLDDGSINAFTTGGGYVSSGGGASDGGAAAAGAGSGEPESASGALLAAGPTMLGQLLDFAKAYWWIAAILVAAYFIWWRK